jgi:hypothetical protein
MQPTLAQAAHQACRRMRQSPRAWKALHAQNPIAQVRTAHAKKHLACSTDGICEQQEGKADKEVIPDVAVGLPALATLTSCGRSLMPSKLSAHIPLCCELANVLSAESK